MTPETLASVIAATAGALLSLAFSYFPRLNTAYAALDEASKKIVMFVLLLVVAIGVYSLSCAGLLFDMFALELACDRGGAILLFHAFFSALFANQGMYTITPQTQAVKEAKQIAKLIAAAPVSETD